MSDVKNSGLATGLVSYWELEESSGTRVDSHGSNDLTDNNTVGQATGIQGDGADFEEANTEYLSITDAAQSGLDITGDHSVSFWIKRESISTGQHILGKDEYGSLGTRCYSYDIKASPSGAIGGFYTSGTNYTLGYTTSGHVDDTNWHHVVIVTDVSAETFTIYVDGDSKPVTYFRKAATTVNDGSSGFTISTSESTLKYDGIIDEVGIWSRILTSGEVADLYNSGSGIPYEAGGAAAEIKTLNGVSNV